MKIRSVGAELFRADRRTDKQTDRQTDRQTEGRDGTNSFFTNFPALLKILRSAHTLYLCVLCGSENKQRLFPYTALTDWLL